MTLSKILGGIILIGAVGAGCGTALAQGSLAGTGYAHGRGQGIELGQPTAGGRTAANPFYGFRDADRHRGHDRRVRGHWPIWGPGYWGYGGGYVYTEPTRDMFGYFGVGGHVRNFDGVAVYEYDRSYPYDWYREPRAERAERPMARRSASYRCVTSFVPDGSGDETVPVRVCRR